MSGGRFRSRNGVVRDFRIDVFDWSEEPGQAMPDGEWHDQDNNEWVVVLRGSVGLRFEGEKDVRVLSPGDYVYIPAGLHHCVEQTDDDQATVWLALHY